MKNTGTKVDANALKRALIGITCKKKAFTNAYINLVPGKTTSRIFKTKEEALEYLIIRYFTKSWAKDTTQ
jgi:hypothetical protein